MSHAFRRYFDLGLDALLTDEAIAAERPAKKETDAKKDKFHAAAAVGLGSAALNGAELWQRLLLGVGVVVVVFTALWLLLRWQAQRKKLHLELSAWLILGLGIFARQNLELSTLTWTMEHFSWGGLLATLCISLAVFPSAMQRFLRSKSSLTMALVAVPFSTGFFLDLTRLGLVKLLPKITGMMKTPVT